MTSTKRVLSPRYDGGMLWFVIACGAPCGEVAGWTSYAAGTEAQDGTFTGCVDVAVDGEIEGEKHHWDLSCAGAFNRLDGEVDWAVVCTPEVKEQEAADLLLGSELVIGPHPDDRAVTGETWEGWLLMESSGGWDSEGESGQAIWADDDSVDLTFRRETTFLTVDGSATLHRSG